MTIETATYISSLNASYPASGDPKSEGDDHIRLVKSTVKATFPNVSGAVTPTHTELNYVDGVTSAIQTQLDAKAALASPALTGTPTAPTATALTNSTQIATTAYTDAAVTALGATKANLASPALTGTPTAPTATAGTSTTQIATTEFVTATAFASALPAQTGNAGKFVTTDGTNASWAEGLPSQATHANKVLKTDGTSSSWTADWPGNTLTVAKGGTGLTTLTANNVILGNGTSNPTFVAPSTSGNLLTSNGTTWQSVAPAASGSMVYISQVVASNSATVDFTSGISSTYDQYVITVTDAIGVLSAQPVCIQVYHAGVLQTSGYTGQYQPNASTLGGLASSAHITTSATTGAGTYNAINMTVTFGGAGNSASGNAITFFGTFVYGGVLPIFGSGGVPAVGATMTGIRFFMAGGNISSGTFRLYGIKNS